MTLTNLVFWLWLAISVGYISGPKIANRLETFSSGPFPVIWPRIWPWRMILTNLVFRLWLAISVGYILGPKDRNLDLEGEVWGQNEGHIRVLRGLLDPYTDFQETWKKSLKKLLASHTWNDALDMKWSIRSAHNIFHWLFGERLGIYQAEVGMPPLAYKFCWWWVIWGGNSKNGI